MLFFNLLKSSIRVELAIPFLRQSITVPCWKTSPLKTVITLCPSPVWQLPEIIHTATDETEIIHTATDETEIIHTATDETEIIHTATDETEIIHTATDETEIIHTATDEINRIYSRQCSS